MIILKSKKINTFTSKNNVNNFNQQIKKSVLKMQLNIKEYEETLNYEYMECPICHSNKLINYGSYMRNVVISNECEIIKIKRVYCKNCGKTHAIIPSFLKPYFQYESSFIDFVVYLIKVKNKKSKQIEGLMKLSRQLIGNWKKRFEEHQTRLQTLYYNCSWKQIFDYIFGEKILEHYYRQNKMYYFEKIPT